HKWFARICASAVVANALIDIDPRYPVLDEATRSGLAQVKDELIASAPEGAEPDPFAAEQQRSSDEGGGGGSGDNGEPAEGGDEGAGAAGEPDAGGDEGPGTGDELDEGGDAAQAGDEPQGGTAAEGEDG